MNKQWIIAVIVLITGLALGWVARTELNLHSGPVAADLAEILSRPQAFSGKIVRVTGKLNECYHWECSICPESMTAGSKDADKCLALEFRPLMPGTGFGVSEKEAIFRFASVTLEAKFDPDCLNSPCLDRPVVLYDAEVRSVISRRPSNSGLWMGNTTKLQAASPSLASEIRPIAYRSGFPENLPVQVFQVVGDPRNAVACWGPVGTAVEWPSTLEAAVDAKSINDYYQCTKVLLKEGAWAMQVAG